MIKNKKNIYLIAGEASGDFLGAQLMKALIKKDPGIRFSGVGGTLMKGQGLQSLFPMEELSVMGVWEILPRLRLILKRINQTTQNIIHTKPDVVVSIDSPDFSFRVMKGVRKVYHNSSDLAPKLFHYVAPTVWAWRPKRAIKIAKFLDGLICLFKFEPPYFEEVGLRAIAAGHPMMESGIEEAIPAVIGGAEAKNLGIFLGSRRGEIKRIAPVIIEAIKKIKAQEPDVELIVPTLPHLEETVKEIILPLDIPCCISTDQADKWALFKACDVAIAVSGTVGLELAAANVPHVIAYKTNPLTAMVVSRMIRIPFAHLANIITREKVVPEFIQQDCTADNISSAIIALINDKNLRDAQQRKFDIVRDNIGSGEVSPSDKAAEFVLDNL